MPADMSTMDLPGGRSTPGVEPADVVRALTRIAAASDRAGVAEAGLEALRTLCPFPAFACLQEGGRLRVVGYRGLDREVVRTLVTSGAFLALVADWRERPLPPDRPTLLEARGSGEALACVAVGTNSWEGVLAAVVPATHRHDADGVADLMGAVAAHVTASLLRVEAAADLHRQERETDGIVNGVPHPVVVVDGGGRFVRMNPAACELFGLTASFDAGLPVAGRLGHKELEAALVGGDQVSELEVELGLPPRTYRASVTQVYDGGTRHRTIVVLDDVSARREHERARNEFAALLGHELRTPLTVSKGFLETVLARGDLLDAHQRDGFLRTALAQLEHLEDLINDLLFLSTECPRPGMRAPECDLSEVVTDAVERFTRRRPEREIDCLVLAADPCAPADSRFVTHALRHLIENALKYTDGPVRVELSGDAAGMEVAVVDQGPGIFSGDLERLFRPFEQLDASSTRREGGTGIGLYVARRLAEALGGRLECDSRLGQGSRFSFRIPRASGAASRRPTARTSTRSRDDARS